HTHPHSPGTERGIISAQPCGPAPLLKLPFRRKPEPTVPLIRTAEQWNPACAGMTLPLFFWGTAVLRFDLNTGNKAPIGITGCCERRLDIRVIAREWKVPTGARP